MIEKLKDKQKAIETAMEDFIDSMRAFERPAKEAQNRLSVLETKLKAAQEELDAKKAEADRIIADAAKRADEVTAKGNQFLQQSADLKAVSERNRKEAADKLTEYETKIEQLKRREADLAEKEASFSAKVAAIEELKAKLA